MNMHPVYDGIALRKFRLVYSESQNFISTFLVKRYNEIAGAWIDRQKLTYNPAFAREAVDEFARAMIQRSSEIQRVGGDLLFQQQVEGLRGGVDRKESSMDAFNAMNVVGELMAMGSVGIYVDNDAANPVTLAEETSPYIYSYKAEDILNWKYTNGKLTTLVLRDWFYEEDNGLPSYRQYRYRRLDLTSEGVTVQYENYKGEKVSGPTLQLTRIPFILLSLPHSLLQETADYQITLLNIASAGAYQVWAANFPLYTEQYSPMDDLAKGVRDNKDATKPDRTLEIGTISGIRYPMNTERPSWIHPSSEPLTATMRYMDKMKEEIRQLTALAITNLAPQAASAESKAQDRLGLESGLAVIGMLLQAGENDLSTIWHEYKGGKPTEINYPAEYSLLSEEERRAKAKELKDLQHAVPSRTFQRETAKSIATALHAHRVTEEALRKMHDEIEKSPVPTSDPLVLGSDHEAGFVSDETASIGRGYAEGEAEKAREDHALRIARIQAAQTSEGSRGLKDLDTNPGTSADNEKKITQDPTKTDNGAKPVRGEA